MKIHFIGVGGIGISALVQYYLIKGHKISGSDLMCSEITETLKKKGVKIFIGKDKNKNLPKNIDLVIYSPAIQKNNSELRQAYKFQSLNSKFQIISYPKALGKLTKKYFTIAIAGTHGKSTTTTMLGLLLIKAGLDPTVFVGTKVKEFGGTNFRIQQRLQLSSTKYHQGKIQYLIIEACEYKNSFLNYSPDIAVITNIEPDHLDYFKNFNNVKEAFVKFTKKIKKSGELITEKEYKKLKDAKKLKKILKVPGEHNVFNALAVLAVARLLKIPDEISFSALSEYRSCWRRFEIFEISQPKKYTLISDYGHHPTEVEATLKATREKYPQKKILCIFQPHQHNRTYHFFNDFIKVLRVALIDKIIITDIYDVAGRENKKIREKISSQKLVKAINKQKIVYLAKEKINKYLQKNLQEKNEEVIIIMGAGDIYELVEVLTKSEKKEKL